MTVEDTPIYEDWELELMYEEHMYNIQAEEVYKNMEPLDLSNEEDCPF